jgi:phage antirepressor YoqD-like protein
MTEYSKQSGKKALQVRQLAALTMLTERTVYRWLADPEYGHRGNRVRLAAAAKRLGIQIQAAPST